MSDVEINKTCIVCEIPSEFAICEGCDDPIRRHRATLTEIEEVIQNALGEANIFNDRTTRIVLGMVVSSYLSELSGEGRIYESKVVCDETNNPQEIIDQNEFVLDVELKFHKDARPVRINCKCVRSGISFEELLKEEVDDGD